MPFRDKLAAASGWWFAMLFTSFATGILLIYAYPENAHKLVRGMFVFSWFAGLWFTLEASSAHYARHRGESQANTAVASKLALLFGLGLAAAWYWQAPQVLQAILCGSLFTSVHLLYKNYRVTEYLRHHHKHHD